MATADAADRPPSKMPVTSFRKRSRKLLQHFGNSSRLRTGAFKFELPKRFLTAPA